MSMESLKVPTYLNKPIMVLFWEVDTFILTILFLIFAITLSAWFWPMVGIAPWGYEKIKSDFPKGFSVHVFYYAGLSGFEGYPDCFIFQEEFIE